MIEKRESKEKAAQSLAYLFMSKPELVLQDGLVVNQ
jgi:hypothetical protein